jgi:serine/arginine repetitive matrix protein 1
MTRVNLELMKPWIATKMLDLLGIDDEVIIGYAFTQLEDTQFPDPKAIQVNLTAFMAKDAAVFMKELWELLVDAQSRYKVDESGKPVPGVPMKILQEQMAKIVEEKVPPPPLPPRADLSRRSARGWRLKCSVDERSG